MGILKMCIWRSEEGVDIYVIITVGSSFRILCVAKETAFLSKFSINSGNKKRL